MIFQHLCAAFCLLILWPVLYGCGKSPSATAADLSGGMVPFPAPRQAADLTETEILGKDAEQEGDLCVPYGDGLLIDSLSGKPQWALYRFNVGSESLDHVRLSLGAVPQSSCFIGLANYATGRWDFSGPFAVDELVNLSGEAYRSPAGDLWVATLAPAGKQCWILSLSVRQVNPDNHPPTAALKVTWPNGNEAPATLRFDASGSTDPDNNILDYSWDLVGGSNWDEYTASPILNYTFQTAGTYHVKVRVRDTELAADTFVYSTPIIIVDPPPPPPENEPPVPDFLFAPSSGNSPLTVEFDARASDDPDGLIVEYAWDWENDGTYDEFSTQPLASHVYTEAGRHFPRLRVTDDEGATAIVVGWSGVGIHPYWVEAKVTSANTFAFGITANGHPACTYSDNTAIYFSRSSDANGAGWPVPTAIGFGAHHPAIGVVNGRPAVVYRQGLQLKYIAALDSNGSAWATPSVVTPCNSSSFPRFVTEINGLPAVAYYEGGVNGVNYVQAADAAGSLWSAAVVVEADAYAFGLCEVAGRPALLVRSASDELKYIRADDPTGQGWTNPLIIDSPVDGSAMEILGGRPAIAYSRADNPGLGLFSRALDSNGDDWPVPSSFDNDVRTVRLAQIAGVPCVAYERDWGGVFLQRATDVDGSGWGTPESIAEGLLSDLLDLGGSPGVVIRTSFYHFE
jgi:PKD repeat protein